MSKAHMPPIPPGNRSPQGSASPDQGGLQPQDAKREIRDRGEHAGQKGQQANIAQNTRNQGYQQDR